MVGTEQCYIKGPAALRGNSAESGVVHEWDGFQSPAKDKLPELSSSSPAWVQSNTMDKVAAAPLRV
jgi:hypothetical protein